MSRYTIQLLIAALAASGAQAQYHNDVYQWNPAYLTNPDNPRSFNTYYCECFDGFTVFIYQAIEDEPFEFEGVTLVDLTDEYYGLGDITLIQALDDAGPVAVTVVGHEGRTYGANNVPSIDLNVPYGSGVTGTLAAMKIAGDSAGGTAAFRVGRRLPSGTIGTVAATTRPRPSGRVAGRWLPPCASAGCVRRSPSGVWKPRMAADR